MRTLAPQVAVVGAGPAGSAAAIRLAESGVDVVLVDRAVFPREKVCGDGLTPRALHLLDELAVWPAVRSHAVPVTALAILDTMARSRHEGLLPNGTSSPLDQGAVVPRFVLDEALRARAVSAGAKFLSGTTMTSVESGPGGRVTLVGAGPDGPITIAAHAVVVADGAEGAIGRRCRPRGSVTMHGIAVRQYWRLTEVAPAFHVCAPLIENGNPLAGYGWVFPLRNGIANVGIGLVSATSGSRRVRELFVRFTHHLRQAVPAWRDGQPLGRLSGGSLRSGIELSPATIDGTLLVGDAVGATNPHTGEGIAQAMETGRIAADVLVTHLGDAGKVRAVYREALRAAFPETTTIGGSQPWLLERGRFFAAEFWLAVSKPTSLVGRSVRRVVLEEAGATASQATHGVPSSVARSERSFRTFECRMATTRPVVAQFLRSVRREDADVCRAMATYWVMLERRHGAEPLHAEQVALALAALLLSMALADDRSSGPLIIGDRSSERRTAWAVDATAIGVADLLLATLFGLLAKLPARLSGACMAGAIAALSAARAGASGAAAARQGAAVDFADVLTPGASLAAGGPAS